MLFWIILFVAGLLFLFSVLPFVPVAHGSIRVMDFPRLQIFTLAGVGLFLAIAFLPFVSGTWLILALFSATLLIQSVYIARFSPFWRRTVIGAEREPPGAEAIRLLVCNVKQSNSDHEKLCRLIEEYRPDIAVFMETDQRWIDGLEDALATFPHRIACPLDNSYGMLLASRLPLSDSHTRFLLNDSVPSFDTVVSTCNTEPFRLIAVHPEPPIPSRDTVGRDAEILLVGETVREERRPVIVTGDLNDVAWSPTTRRFLRISRLRDPRQGRGLYNSFDARYPFLRWPLDHIFLSSHFRIASMKRLPFVGSDHFPIMYDVVLDHDAASQQRDRVPAERSDFREAETLIEEARDRNRPPVGTDWEES